MHAWLRSFFLRLTDAPATVVGREQRRRIRLLSTLIVVLIPLGLAAAGIQVLLLPGMWPTFFVVAAALLVLCLAYLLARTGWYLHGARLAVGVTVVGGFAVVALNPLDAMANAFLFIGIFLAGLLFEEAGVWITGLLTLLGVAVLLPALGVPSPRGDPAVVPTFLVVASALLLLSIRHRNALERDRRVELAASEARFRALFHASPTVMTLGRFKDDRLRDVNRAFEEWSGWSRDEAIDRTTLDLGFWSDLEEHARVRALLADDVSIRDVELRVRIRSGEMRDLLCSFELLQLESEDYMLVTVVDITERKLAERDTRRLNRLLGTLGAVNPVLVSTTSEAHLFAGVCRTLVEQGEFTMAWIGIADMTSPRVRLACQSGFRHGYLENLDIRYDDSLQGQGPTGTAIRSGQTVINDDTETNARFAPWRERAREHGYRSTAAIPLRVDGQVVGSLNVYAAAPGAFGSQEILLLEKLAGDIGMALERLRGMARIESSERELATILQNMQDTYYRTDLDGRIVRASAAATKLLGYTPQEMEGKRLADFYLDPAGRAQFLAALQASGGALQNYEAELRHRDGSGIWVSTNAQYVRDAGGDVVGVEGTVRNISERKHAEQALRASEMRYRTIVETAQEGIWTIDAESRTTFVNRKMAEILGYTVEEMRGRSMFDFMDAEGRAIAARNVERRKQGIAEQHDFEFLCKDGTRLWVELNTCPLYDTTGAYTGALAMATDISERRRSERALRDSEAMLAKAQEVAHIGSWWWDIPANKLICSRELLNLYGFPPDLTGSAEEVLARIWQVIHPEDRERFQRAMEQLLATGDTGHSIEYRVVLPDGRERTVLAYPEVVRGADGRALYTYGALQDITERKLAEAEMGKLSSAVEQIADTVMITSREGVIEYVNPAFERTTGYGRAEAIGQNPRLVKSGKQGAAFYRKLWTTILDGEIFSDVFINRRKDGSLYYEEKTITPIKDGSGEITHFVSTGKDVTERIEVQEQLQHMAQHDALTELPNRALLLDRLKQSMARARWHQRLVAVLFIDLDRFKTINDTLGHDVGDRLLQQLAERFGRCVREGDTVARFGGDEFVILLDDVADDQDVGGVAQKVLDVLAAPFTVEHQKLYITASIGVSLFPSDGDDSGTLLRNADIAMYRAKELGKNTYQFYSSDMSARAFERLSLETSLRNALERHEFVLHYQPQVDTDTGRIVGVEALIRWQHPDFGIVPPADFIPLLEETGLIVPTGEWVLDTACKQLHAWHQAGWPELRLAVNLSPRQFHTAGLEAVIERSLDCIGRDPGLLELEITEGVILSHTRASLDTLAGLRELGVRLAVDDFGTGYSSLSYLRRFPIDTLKIDRSFVQDIPDDPDDSAITTTIIVLAQNLKLDVIAEGVENEAQRDFLRRQGCRLMQGYLFSRPLPAVEITRLLETRNNG